MLEDQAVQVGATEQGFVGAMQVKRYGVPIHQIGDGAYVVEMAMCVDDGAGMPAILIDQFRETRGVAAGIHDKNILLSVSNQITILPPPSVHESAHLEAHRAPPK
jgi:hypothetical protein